MGFICGLVSSLPLWTSSLSPVVVANSKLTLLHIYLFFWQLACLYAFVCFIPLFWKVSDRFLANRQAHSILLLILEVMSTVISCSWSPRLLLSLLASTFRIWLKISPFKEPHFLRGAITFTMVDVTILLPTRLNRRHWQSVVTFPSSPVSLVAFLHLETFPTMKRDLFSVDCCFHSDLPLSSFNLKDYMFLLLPTGSKNNRRASATQIQFLSKLHTPTLLSCSPSLD